MLHRVGEEVREHPHHERLVREHREVARLDREGHPTRPRLGGQLLHALLREIGEVRHLRIGLEPALLHLVDVEQCVDHPQELGHVRLGETEQLAELAQSQSEIQLLVDFLARSQRGIAR